MQRNTEITKENKMNKASKIFLKDLLKMMNKHNVILWGNDIGKQFETRWTFVDTNYSQLPKKRIHLEMGQIEGKIM